MTVYFASPKASRYALALTLATIIAGPISGLLIGVSIGQTHFSRSTPQLFAWGRNFALALSLLLLAFNLQYTFILAVIERHGFMRAFGKPKIAQIIWPVLTASTEMVAQFYFTEKIRKVTKSLVWTTIPRLLGAFSFAVACTRTILIGKY
ncbi:hypothetical protein BY996DRAFT_589283 [Phakopsora pachyrhizi]|nr:hypothetical protein BY996DRAFT_589283 [Phakopsora pachyrhizi]